MAHVIMMVQRSVNTTIEIGIINLYNQLIKKYLL